MECCSYSRTPPLFSSSSSSSPKTKTITIFFSHSFFTQSAPTLSNYHQSARLRTAALKGPRGFGPPPKKKTPKTETKKKPKRFISKEEEDEEEEYEDDEEEGVIPEIVTNRMMNRVGVSVGVPLFVGLIFFPFFYYLKVGLKIDIPTWVPFIVSSIFFGSALLGVSYGIVSSSWDPMREGSLLGWNEAKKNWPVFWQSLRGRPVKR